MIFCLMFFFLYTLHEKNDQQINSNVNLKILLTHANETTSRLKQQLLRGNWINKPIRWHKYSKMYEILNQIQNKTMSYLVKYLLAMQLSCVMGVSAGSLLQTGWEWTVPSRVPRKPRKYSVACHYVVDISLCKPPNRHKQIWKTYNSSHHTK